MIAEDMGGLPSLGAGRRRTITGELWLPKRTLEQLQGLGMSLQPTTYMRWWWYGKITLRIKETALESCEGGHIVHIDRLGWRWLDNFCKNIGLQRSEAWRLGRTIWLGVNTLAAPQQYPTDTIRVQRLDY